MTMYANAFVPGFENRDPYWLVAGWEVNGTLVWSQPEIILYVLAQCEDARCGIGYPDFIEVCLHPLTYDFLRSQVGWTHCDPIDQLFFLV